MEINGRTINIKMVISTVNAFNILKMEIFNKTDILKMEMEKILHMISKEE
jgi:hypothetical protein